MENNKLKFAENFKMLLTERSISVTSLSEATGFSVTRINNWLAKKSQPCISQLLILMDFFQCKAQFLLCGKE